MDGDGVGRNPVSYVASRLRRSRARPWGCPLHLPGNIDAALVQNSNDGASLAPCWVVLAVFEAGTK
jgi:hypothetical protein